LEVPVYSVTQEEGKWMSRSLKRGKPVRVRLHTRSYCKEIDTANIVVTFPGKTEDTIIVGGHFDSWDLGQGAMDNGLGTAQLFAVAKALQEFSPKNLRTVELIWFNGEEQGLWGSRHHAPTTRGRSISAMINLDMVGLPHSVNSLGFADLIPVLEGFDASLGAHRLEKGVENTNWFGSDHTPYQLEGVRSITFGAPIAPEDVRYYHDFGDTFDKIDDEMLKNASAVIVGLTFYLANIPELDNSRASDETVKSIFKSKALRARMRNSGMWRFGDDDEEEETAK
jgi:Zn-dependent M28 family amino/carboxypeptidase